MTFFIPHTDPLCLSLFNYVYAPTPLNLHYISLEIDKLTMAQFFEVSSNGTTRLLTIMQILHEHNQLEENLDIIKKLLNHACVLESHHPNFNKSPVAFLLYYKDINHLSAYTESQKTNHSKMKIQLECLSPSDLTFLINIRCEIEHGICPKGNATQKQRWERNNYEFKRRAINQITAINPINYFKITYNSYNNDGYSFLESVIRTDMSTHNFQQAIYLLMSARQKGWIEKSECKNYLLGSRKEGICVLHQLLLVNSTLGASNLSTYLQAVDDIAKYGTLDAYVAIFKECNTHGYSIMHQAINAPDFEITKTFMQWFEHECTLPNDIKFTLLNFKNPESPTHAKGAKRPPRRCNSKEGHTFTRYKVEYLKDKYASKTEAWRQTLYGTFFAPQETSLVIEIPATYADKIWCEELKGWHLSGNDYISQNLTTDQAQVKAYSQV